MYPSKGTFTRAVVKSASYNIQKDFPSNTDSGIGIGGDWTFWVLALFALIWGIEWIVSLF